MAGNARIKWTPESGWLALVPSALPSNAVVTLMAYALKVYRQRLLGMGPGDDKAAMTTAVDHLQAMVVARVACEQVVLLERGRDTKLLAGEAGFTPRKMISVGGQHGS